jgi:predicted nucleic acid-binding protein
MMTDPAIAPRRYLADTNVLVAISLGNDDVNKRMEQLERAPSQFFIGLQNLCEFWNVSTRPSTNNGLGLSPEFTLRAIERIQLGFEVLPETNVVLREFTEILRTHRIWGKQIYDAKLVALLRAHSLDGIITFNARDFVRYAGANPISPSAQVP